MHRLNSNLEVQVGQAEQCDTYQSCYQVQAGTGSFGGYWVLTLKANWLVLWVQKLV